MMTKKQAEWVASYLSALGEEARPLYEDIILCLTGLGYHPARGKTAISFKHDMHNKQIAKIGIKKNTPFFALRFSACRGYSRRFAAIVADYILKYPSRAARCVTGGCNFCRGEAGAHVYTCSLPGGGPKTHCGAYALEIPNLSAQDMAEIRKLIAQEHEFLIKHEAGAD